jgi:hypothetical protein
MFITAWQIYYQHIDDWEDDSTLRPNAIEDSWRFTGLVTTDYMHGFLTPTLFAMYDPKGTWMTNASLKYTPDGRWYFQISQMSFWGNRQAISPFAGLIDTSELSFRIGHQW